MTRSWFGGTADSLTYAEYRFGAQLIPALATGAVVSFWSAETDGTRYTDLLVNGSAATSVTTTSHARLPRFQGPDSITSMWADGGNGRFLVVTTDASTIHDDRVAAEAAATAAQAVGSTNDTIIAGRINTVGSSTRTALDALYRPWLNAKVYGVVGNGTTDDTSALQAFLDALKASGGVGYIPAGTYKITTRLDVTSGSKPLVLFGDGENATIIRRGSTMGNIWQFQATNNFIVRDIGVDGGAVAFPSGAAHALIAVDCSYARFERVRVTNYGDTGIFVYSSSDTTRPVEFVIESCTVVGNGLTTNNGMMLNNMDRSFMRNCKAIDVLGTPGIGLQLKKNCYYSGVINGYAQNCDDGYSFGTDVAGVANHYCQSENLIAFNCIRGVTVGETYDCAYNGVLVDMASRSDGLRAIGLSSTVRATVTGVHISNVTAVKNAILMQGTDCTLEAGLIAGNDSAPVVNFDTGGSGNHVSIKRVLAAGVEVPDSSALAIWAGSNNALDYGSAPNMERLTIASDTITVKNKRTRVVIVDTEAAAATDNLTNILGGYDGQVITMHSKVNARDVTVTNGTNIMLSGSNFVLDGVADRLTLMYDGTVGHWVEVSRSNNF